MASLINAKARKPADARPMSLVRILQKQSETCSCAALFAQSHGLQELRGGAPLKQYTAMDGERNERSAAHRKIYERPADRGDVASDPARQAIALDLRRRHAQVQPALQRLLLLRRGNGPGGRRLAG